jgi:hypothetical protein
MLGRRIIRCAVVVASVLAWMALPSATAFASPISLFVPQSTAFAILGHSCGGIQEKAFASGFNATSGYPIGDVRLQTTCSSGGRGSRPTTYSAWVATAWDFTGALVSDTKLQTAPTVNPTLSVYDSHGNHLYNQSNQAYLVLGPGFVPAPRVSGVSPTSGPQGSSVAIAGTGFTGVVGVRFGATAAHFTVTSSMSMTAIAPAVRTGTVDITVTNSGGTSAQTTSDRFTFALTPRVSGVSPKQGSADGGDSVTITGVNFTGATAVGFGGVAASFRVVSDTSIAAVSAPGPDSGVTVDITVTSPYGTSAISASDRFTYT